jgi:hypothetical protein
MGKLFPAFSLKKRDRLSRFLPRHSWISSRSLSRKAGLLNFCSCTHDKFAMAVAPGHPHLHAIKILVPLDACCASVRAYGMTILRLKYRDSARCCRRVTPTKRYRRAVRLKLPAHCPLYSFLSNQLKL